MQHFSKKKKDDMEQVASIEELLTEILVRLPARPLVRFKCVSKHWLSLISDPKFCRRHTLQNFRPSVSAVFPYPSRSTTALSFIPLGALGHNPRSSNHANQTLPCSTNSCHPFNFVPNLHEIMIFQSCNGLFLCCPRVTTIPPRYYVLNPTTNQFSTIIYPGHVSTYISHQALAFDPSRSPHYKLLLFRGVSFWDSDLFIDIYSSETKSWRIAESSFSNLDCHPKYNGVVYCNGAVHWVGDPKQISYYHINDERVGHVFELDRRTHESKYGFLQESHCGGSHLHLIDIYSSHIQVLELERDYSGFRLKYHIELDRIFTTLLWPRKMKFSVLYLSREKIEGDESSYLLLHNPGQIFWYNLKSNISKSFQLTPRRASKEELRVGLPNIKGVLNFQYMETLAGV